MDETDASEDASPRRNRRSILQATGVVLVGGALLSGTTAAQVSDEMPESATDTYEESLEQADAAENAVDEGDFEMPEDGDYPEQNVSVDGETEYDSEEVSQQVTNESTQSSNESVEISDVTGSDDAAVTENVSTEGADASESGSDDLDVLSELEFDIW